MAAPTRRLRRVLVRLGWAAAVLVIAVAILRSTVGDVYRVGSSSMRPTILGGPDPRGGAALDERVLVRFDTPGGAADLVRFELVVVRRGADPPIIKRACGLPGESVGIAGGDLLIDGARLGPDVPRPAPIPVFDSGVQAVPEHFVLRAGPAEPWSEEDGVWRLDAREVPAGSDAGLMLFAEDLRDGYLDRRGRRIRGTVEVNDARVACEVAPATAGGVLRFRLVEAGDTFEARLAPSAAGRAEATIVRFNSSTLQDPDDPDGRVRELARGAVALPLDEWTPVTFENLDNHLLLDVGGDRLTSSYAANEPHAGPTAEGATSLGPRVALGGARCRASFRAIRVARDLYYLAIGTHGVERPLVLGPDELFVLGDNSAASRDSRMLGPIPLGRVIGRPTHVVWPPSRARRLPDPTPR